MEWVSSDNIISKDDVHVDQVEYKNGWTYFASGLLIDGKNSGFKKSLYQRQNFRFKLASAAKKMCAQMWQKVWAKKAF